MTNVPQTRAAILQQTIEKFRTAGIPFDNDPIVHGWLEAWIDGGLKMSAIAQRYQDLLKTRLAGKTRPAEAGGQDAWAPVANALDAPAPADDPHRFMDQHELLEEVARLLADRSDSR